LNINTDINVLGSLKDFSIITLLLTQPEVVQSHTLIKTIGSYQRYINTINRTLLKFQNSNVETLVRGMLLKEDPSFDSLLTLFWNASANNELLDYLNQKVYFPALYSGRMALKKDEIFACLQELKQSEFSLQDWSDYTIDKIACKYLTVLKKFNLMQGSQNKTILHHHINDKLLMHFVFWLLTVGTKSNILESQWLSYSLMEKEVFVQRILQKKFIKFIHINFTGDKLFIEPVISYKALYDGLL
jgi:hypothetical protein